MIRRGIHECRGRMAVVYGGEELPDGGANPVHICLARRIIYAWDEKLLTPGLTGHHIAFFMDRDRHNGDLFEELSSEVRDLGEGYLSSGAAIYCTDIPVKDYSAIYTDIPVPHDKIAYDAQFIAKDSQEFDHIEMALKVDEAMDLIIREMKAGGS